MDKRYLVVPGQPALWDQITNASVYATPRERQENPEERCERLNRLYRQWRNET